MAEHEEEESAEHHEAPQQHKVDKQEKVGEKDKGGDKPPTSLKRSRTRTPQRVESAVAEERFGSSSSGGDTGREGFEVTRGETRETRKTRETREAQNNVKPAPTGGGNPPSPNHTGDT